MCMRIGYSPTHYLYETFKEVEKLYQCKTKRAKSKVKTITVYKILRLDNGKLKSYYKRSVWKKGEVKVSSRKRLKNPTELTPFEKQDLVLDHGLHFFISKKDAESWLWDKYSMRGSIIEIWAVEVNTKDIVSYGQYDEFVNLVAHKAKLIKKVG